jgi:hypothetical protein
MCAPRLERILPTSYESRQVTGSAADHAAGTASVLDIAFDSFKHTNQRLEIPARNSLNRDFLVPWRG